MSHVAALRPVFRRPSLLTTCKFSHCSHDDIIAHSLSAHKDQLFDLKQTAWLIVKTIVLYPSNAAESSTIWPNRAGQTQRTRQPT